MAGAGIGDPALLGGLGGLGYLVDFAAGGLLFVLAGLSGGKFDSEDLTFTINKSQIFNDKEKVDLAKLGAASAPAAPAKAWRPAARPRCPAAP